MEAGDKTRVAAVPSIEIFAQPSGAMQWLLAGDTALQYQTWRDVLDEERPELEHRVALDGDAAGILSAQGPDGHWGRGFYEPQWTCSHYTLLELRDLGVAPTHPSCVRTVALLTQEKGEDGGVNPAGGVQKSDVCINGMFLSYASHFRAEAEVLESVVDFVLGQQMDDGGFNCRSNRSGARTASVHSTTSVIDGLAEYLRRDYVYRSGDVLSALLAAAESLLARRLYQRRSDHEPIRAEFTRLHHPARWHFDVLHGLDVLRAAQIPWDPRLEDALRVIESRRRRDGRWVATSQYPGQTHIAYPHAGSPSRWVTLRALRVLRAYRHQR